MYLDMLTEEERVAFLDLAWAAVECDGEIAQEELAVMSSYANECHLAVYERKKAPLAELTARLANAERAHKKIVLLELMGIWGADGEWRDAELKMMDEVATGLGIPDSRVNRIRRWSREFRQMIIDGYKLVMED